VTRGLLAAGVLLAVAALGAALYLSFQALNQAAVDRLNAAHARQVVPSAGVPAGVVPGPRVVR
jgi:hypothetical protein